MNNYVEKKRNRPYLKKILSLPEENSGNDQISPLAAKLTLIEKSYLNLNED